MFMFFFFWLLLQITILCPIDLRTISCIRRIQLLPLRIRILNTCNRIRRQFLIIRQTTAAQIRARISIIFFAENGGRRFDDICLRRARDTNGFVGQRIIKTIIFIIAKIRARTFPNSFFHQRRRLGRRLKPQSTISIIRKIA